MIESSTVAKQSTLPTDQNQQQLIDQFGRYKNKLRISLTDRCNFRCHYCMPDQPNWLAKKNILTFEEIIFVCKIMIPLGISHIRLTGGEPLMRKDIVQLITALNALRPLGLKRISMTTNAYYLAEYAQALKNSGLDDLNISLDSIRPETFLAMTKKPLAPVLKGITAALESGIPIKLNCVLVAHQNEQEIVEITQWAYRHQIPLRFIEYMPLDQPKQWQLQNVITEDSVLSHLEPHFNIEKQPRSHDPATIYRLNQHYPLGIISTISKPFCQTCDRLRLTAQGELFTCLFAATGTPLRELIQTKNIADLRQHIKTAVWYKDAGFITQPIAPSRKITMHAIGG